MNYSNPLTVENIQNLRTHLEWLKENVKDENFSLGSYVKDESLCHLTEQPDLSEVVNALKTDPNYCGTTACVIGWTPNVFPEEAERAEDFSNLSLMLFGFYDGTIGECANPVKTALGRFLFSANLKYIDDSIDGAVKRMDYALELLNSPEIPEDFINLWEQSIPHQPHINYLREHNLLGVTLNINSKLT